MKQLIERLRELEAKEYPGLQAFKPGNTTQVEYLADLFEVYDALPQLLDRLEKLEAVAEAAKGATTERDKIKRAGYINGLAYALAALEGKK